MVTKGRSGFSLMEVMVAVALLALAVTMMMPVIPLGLERLRDMRMRETAVWLAEQEIEQVRQVVFSNITSSAKQNTTISPLQKSVTVVDRSSTLKEVTVKIYWPNVRSGGDEKQISLVTLISKNGVNR
ncbi:MAG: prepilin-type N-terminal cleavage/methylation domain-containing protein [Candidatus Omnitrophica bacterium]|nr:prepilin-type N-terminal cleavage/methylation domain-containing protein [Candidatus Omnitrophota bacterium]